MLIKYLRHNEIDKQLWDKTLESSINNSVYAQSWYLDIVSAKWEALIIGNYEYIFPLTQSKKAGINYILQPYYTQQLGIFSAQKADNNIIDLFINNIPKKFKYIDINLNELNSCEKCIFTTKPNTLLDLNRPYSDLHKDYNTNTKRNIKKAEKNNLRFSDTINLDEYKTLKGECLGAELSKVPIENLHKIIEVSFAKSICKIVGAYKDDKLCSAVVFVNSSNRIIYLNACSNQTGTENKAMFLVLDSFIKNNSNSNRIIDFEGSAIEGVSRFFKGFGGNEVNYYNYKKNSLPWVLRLVKK